MRWSKRAKQSIAIALTFALAFTMNVPLGAWATYAGPSSETTSPETSTAPTAAQTFEALVAALPEAEAVTADDADAVAAAQGAYDALSEADKALVAESFAKLEAVEAALAALSAPAPLAEGSPDPGTTPSAGTNAAAWDGTVGTGFAGGDGTADDPYQIADAAQLAYLAQRVNAGTSYSGQYFKLTADIDLNNKAWTPIGIGSRNPTTEDPSTAYFEGIFDGGGRSISNLGVEYNLDNHGAGLFGTVKNAVIKNVNVVSGTVSNTVDSAAGVVAVLLGDSGQVIDCSNGATVTGNSVGGVVARAYATSNTVSGCSNSGAITGTVKAGGVACITGGTATEIKGCSNTGKVTGGSFGLGGVLGYGAAGVTVSDCRNEGTIGESNYRYAGGIVGYATGSGSKVLNGTNTGAIAASECSGGIVGIVTGSWGVEGSSNEGEISKADKAGGIVGSNQSGLITSSKNTGSVSGSYAGGVAGSLGTGGTVEGCAGGASSVTGTVAAGRLMGAIANGPNDEQSAFLSIDDANGDSYEGLGSVGIMGPHTGWGYLTVKSGTFWGEPPVGQGDGVLVFPGSGSSWEDKPDVAGIWRRNVNSLVGWAKQTSYVAETGGTGYATLAEAVAAAEAGGTVALLADVTVNAQVSINKTLVIDLNGKTMTNAVSDARVFDVAAPNVQFTIDGSAAGSAVTIPESNAQAMGTVYIEEAGTGSTVTLKSGTYTGATAAGGNLLIGTPVDKQMTVSINLVDVNATGTKSLVDIDIRDGGGTVNATVSGGTYEATNGYVFALGGVADTNRLAFDNVKATATNDYVIQVYGPVATFTNCTFDVGGTSDDRHPATAVAVSGNGTADIVGGSYTSKHYGVYVYSSGGTINVQDGTVSGDVAAVKADENTDAYPGAVSVVNVSGGTITGALMPDANSEMSVTGGTFSSDVTPYVAQGYIAVENADGTRTVEPAIAAIGDDRYTTLEDAFAAANVAKAPTGIKLLSNAEVAQSITLTNANLVTLDLNGFTADFSGSKVQLLVQGALAIDDTSEAKVGSVKGSKMGLVSVTDGGKLKLVNGKIENTTSRAVHLKGATTEFVMDQGSVLATGYGVYAESHSVFIMNNGIVSVGSGGYGVHAFGGSFTMYGGTVESKGYYGVSSGSSGAIKILSGNIKAGGTAVNVGLNCSAILLGGAFDASSDSTEVVSLAGASSTLEVGEKGADNSQLKIKVVKGVKGSLVKLHQGVRIGLLRSLNGPLSSDSVFECSFESDITECLPAELVCEKQAGGELFTVAHLEKNDPRTVATISNGATVSQWVSVKTAARALQDGETLTLMKDVTGESAYSSSGLITVDGASNVTVDLNGHDIVNSAASTVGYGLHVKNVPTDARLVLKNGGAERVKISGPSALYAGAKYNRILNVVLEGDIELVSSSVGASKVVLENARIPYSAVNESLVTNGGYKAKDAGDGKSYIYGAFGVAIKYSADDDKTAYLLSDCTSSAGIAASGTATLDLQGHTFTSSEGTKPVISPNSAETHLVVKNGKIVSTANADKAIGIGCIDPTIKNFTLTLDGVEVAMQNGGYAAYVNGSLLGATLNLRNSTLTTDADSVGVYFPCTDNGKLNIENTVTTAGTGIGIKGGTVSISGDKTVVNATGSKFVPSAGLDSGINDTGDAVYLEGNYATTASIAISGGTFKSAHGNAVQMLLNLEDPAYAKTISITGGTFSSDPSAYVAAGYSANEQNGEYVVEKIVVAKIAEQPYASLQDAFDAAQDGQTITLIADVVVDGGKNVVRYYGGKNFEVDFAGHSVTGNTTNAVFVIIGNSESESVVTLKNGVVTAGPGAVCTVITGAQTGERGATVNIDTMVLNNSRQNGNSIKALSGSVINVSNTTVNSTNGAGGTQAAGGQINIVDCAYNQKGFKNYNSVNIAASGGGVATIKGGTYKAESYGLYVFDTGGTIKVEGGTFEAGTAVLKADDSLKNTPSAIQVFGGSFTGPISIGGKSTLSISGASTYSHDPSAYVANGYAAKQDGDRHIVAPETYEIALDRAGGSFPQGTVVPESYTVESEVTLPVPERAGYDFAGWTGTGLGGPSTTVTIPKGSTGARDYVAAWTPRTDTAYTVKHLFQSVEGDGYALNDAKTQTLLGTTEADTAAQALSVTGFTAQAIAQQKIAGDGSTVVEVRYDRNVHEVSYAFEGTVPSGASRLPAAHQVRYGAPVVAADAATAPGYDFNGWGVTAGLAMPDEDLVLSGSFTARGDTAYRVEHYQQGLDGAYALAAADNLTGETGAEATAVPKTFAGFSLNEGAPGTVAQGAIAGDGSLVLKLYYDRNAYQVSYAYTGAVPAGAPAVPATASVKFGQQVEPAAAPAMTGYAFSGWSRAEAFAMPAENVVVTGSWTPNADVSYTVRYLLDGTATKLVDDKVVEGRTFGEAYTEQAPAIAGYTVKGQPAQSITLDAYGKELVFSYTANEARIVFDSNGGPDIPDLVGKTGEIVEGSLPAPERAAHAFVGWYAEKSLINQVTALPATFPVGTTTYVAKWNAVPLPPETTGNVEIQVEVPAPPDNGDAHATVTDEALKAAAKHAEGALEDLENGEVPTGMSAEDAEDLADLVSGADKADVKVVVSLGFQQMSEEEVADGEKGTIGDVAADGETAALYLDLSVKMVVRVEKDGSVVEREVPLDEVDEPLLFEIHVDPALLQAKTVRIAHVHEGKTEIIVPESVDRVRGIIRIYAKEFSTYALLTSATCVVSFDVGGGSAINPQTVAFGQVVRKPADPTRAGFSFAGWFADAACTQPYDFAAPVEQPLTLYAKWTAVGPGPGPGPSPGPGPDPDPGASPKPEGGDAQGLVPLDTTPKGSSAGRSVGTGDGTGVLMASLAGVAALAAVCALAAALRRRRGR